MNQTTIDSFRDYLISRNYCNRSVAGYIRTISDLAEPPGSSNPVLMLDFVDSAVGIKKKQLSTSNFNTARASLNALFLLKTGMKIEDFRRQCITPDRYTHLMERYSDYCTSFLQLTEEVTKAAVREARHFLSATSRDPEQTDWTGITADDIVKYLKTERSNLSTASLGVTVTAIRRFFRFLEHDECKIHASILCLPLSVPNWSKSGNLPVVLTQEQSEWLASLKFDNTLTGLRDHAILLCFMELGLRCSEVAGLQFDDIRWSSGTLLIRKTKTHTQRELPISEKLGKALEDYVLASRKIISGTYLFFKSQRHISEPASTENVRSVIRRLFQKGGITGWHMGTHTLRRTAGSRFYNAGNGLKTVADLLGHTSINTTKTYVRTDIISLRAVASSWPRRDMK